jgi:hypothetical protein
MLFSEKASSGRLKLKKEGYWGSKAAYQQHVKDWQISAMSQSLILFQAKCLGPNRCQILCTNKFRRSASKSNSVLRRDWNGTARVLLVCLFVQACITALAIVWDFLGWAVSLSGPSLYVRSA